MRELRYPRLWQGLGWLLVAVVVVLSLMPVPPTPPVITWDKLQHLLGYGVLAYWFRQAFGPRLRWIVLLILLGVVLEIFQGLSGYRYFEWVDMVANTLGVACGAALAATRAGRLVAVLDRRLAPA